MTPEPIIFDPEYHTEQRILARQSDDERIRLADEALRVDIRIVIDAATDVLVVTRSAPMDGDRMAQFSELARIAKQHAERIAAMYRGTAHR